MSNISEVKKKAKPRPRLRKPYKPRKQIFAFIPREILWHPPIAHRGQQDDQEYLTPFEFALMVGCWCLASAQLKQQDHNVSFGVGGEAIQTENGFADEHPENWRGVKRKRATVPKKQRELAQQQQQAYGHAKWRAIWAGEPTPEPPDPQLRLTPAQEHPAPKRKTLVSEQRYAEENLDRWRRGEPADRSLEKPIGRQQSIKIVGHDSYRNSMRKLAKVAKPESITITSSKSALLRAAGLRTDGNNLGHLLSALDRLCRPMGPPLLEQPALQGVRQLANGKLQLQITGLWLQPAYAPVPLPLPTTSPAALALYLFLHTINTNPLATEPRSIRFVNLCQRLGIPTHWGPAVAERALNRAMQIVNEHLQKLPIGALLRANIKVPMEYDIKLLDGGCNVRLIHNPRPYRPHECEEEEPEEQEKAKVKKKQQQPKPVKRVLFTPQAEQRMQLQEHRQKMKLYDAALAGDVRLRIRLGYAKR